MSALLTPVPALADVAPPQQPPGAAILPGSQTTQVRMLAETVTLTVLSKPDARYLGQAKTEAVFTMRNLGSAEEKMQARFPLTFWTEGGDGRGRFPEIPDIRIRVDGKTVPTRRINQPYVSPTDPAPRPVDTRPGGGGTPAPAPTTPWAAFDVSFPPGKDVTVIVDYTTNGYGYAPYFTLRYVLETGAGWYGTIGSADVIVRLPYTANLYNTLLAQDQGLPPAAILPGLVGSEIRWHAEDFEPASADNIQVTLVQTSVWQQILDLSATLAKHPDDGESWGQLGKLYKLMVTPGGNKGDRTDLAGDDMYRLSIQAYRHAVTLLPEDARWHYGYADLLWGREARWIDVSSAALDEHQRAALAGTLDQLHQALALDPHNPEALDLASWISTNDPWALSARDQGYDYLILTATPTLAPVLTSTPAPEPTITLAATAPVATDAPQPSPLPTGGAPGTPFCGGGVAFTLPMAALAIWQRRAVRRL